MPRTHGVVGLAGATPPLNSTLRGVDSAACADRPVTVASIPKTTVRVKKGRGVIVIDIFRRQLFLTDDLITDSLCQGKKRRVTMWRQVHVAGHSPKTFRTPG